MRGEIVDSLRALQRGGRQFDKASQAVFFCFKRVPECPV